MFRPRLTRRDSLRRFAASALAAVATAWLQPVSANLRKRTPSQGEGPFYPVTKPVSVSNDLIHGPGGAVAEGQALRLHGKVVQTNGQALPGARVEIWQCDNRAIYRHPRAAGQGGQDSAFAGYGETVTNASGEYEFLTIVPVAYPGRPPHIHAKVVVPAQGVLTTQLYLGGHPDNASDGLLGMLRSSGKDRLMMMLTRGALPDGSAGKITTYDFVV